MTNYIWVTAQRAMFHRYIKAPKKVIFLRSLHRHIFKFKVYLEVFSNDRDIEFFLFQDYINNLIYELDENLENRSCEMLANWVAKRIGSIYKNRKIKIEVSEDGENGVEFHY